MARRCMLLACAGLVLQSSIVVAQSPLDAARLAAPIVTLLRPSASALLAIDQNRATVIDRIVTQWGEPLAQSSAALSAEQLRTLLSGLRADHLLAASLAGNLDGLRNAIATAVTSTAVVSQNLLPVKALGDTNDDLVYTPINPCRIVDTRLGAGGFLGNDTERDWKVSRPGGSFTDQGGSGSDCAIPASPAAVLANFAVTGSSSPGVLFAWAFNQPAPTASTLNYAGGETIANAVIVPLGQGLAEDLSVFVSTGTNVVVDVVGYFKPPGGAGPYFANGGNVFGTTAKLGTLDNQPLEIYVGNLRSMRFEPSSGAPNIIGGYPDNSATGANGSVIAGGGGSASTTCVDGTVSVPCNNRVGGGSSWAFVGGGAGNLASASVSVVSGGFANTASGISSSVGGGKGNVASGQYSVVAGGELNTASGAYSLAFGHNALANQDRCVVFGLWSNGSSAQCLGTPSVFKVMGDNGFSVDYHLPVSGGGDRWLAIGPFSQFGVPATIVTWNHAYLSDAGVWVNASSSRATKTDFQPVDVDVVLRKLAQMPITTWRYREGEGEVHHMGPMSEDFYAAFTVGYGPQTIADLDARGVEFAAIQGLNLKVEERAAALQLEIAAKDAKIDAQARELEELRKRLARIEAVVTSQLHATH